MYSLFIDTHSDTIHLVLYKDGIIVDTIKKTTKTAHSQYTTQLINDLFHNNKVLFNQLNEIIVVNGPGSFTGVRIGVTIAKTMAYLLNIKIKVISSLQIRSLSNTKETNKLISLKDPKGYYYGLFDKNNELIENMKYLSNQDFKEYLLKNNYQNILVEDLEDYDYNAIYEYAFNIKAINAHNVKPIYIKTIEVLK